MEKSKLPKASGLKPPSKPSALRAPLVTFKAKEFENSQNIVEKPLSVRLTRRSKSVTDLKQFSRQISAEKSISKPLVRQLATEKALVAKNGATKKPVPTGAKTAAKRPAEKPVTSNMGPKPAKQAKLPDWDYKGRFHQLSEKYEKAIENNKDLRQKLTDFGDFEQKYESLQNEFKEAHENRTTLGRECATLKSDNKNLLSELNGLKKQFSVLEKKHVDLVENHTILQQQDEEKSKKIEGFEEKCKNYEENVQILTEERDTLSSKYDSVKTLHDKLVMEHETNLTNNLSLKQKLDQEISKNKELEKQNAYLKSAMLKSEVHRRTLHNMIQDLKGNIRVFCRVRPPINQAEEEKLQCSLAFNDENLEIRKTRESVSVSGKPIDHKAEFEFDRLFTPTSSQDCVFQELAQLVQSALDGYHVCVFAYGQTGSGKTHTMQGSTDNPGMIPRTIDLIFDTIDELTQTGWKYTVEASFLEIYNENIKDLLDIHSTRSFDIRFNEGKGTTVTNLTIQHISGSKELKELMALAHKNRSVAATDFNEHSSRSHAVTKLYLQGNHKESGTVYTGSLNLVDLAGSESAKTSSSERIAETKCINKSLSTLGTVMLALYNKDNHIPFRNSKLTYLLQSSLGGNSKTLMIVNIAPFEECYGESISSLRFATQVKEVKLGIKRNKIVQSK